MDKKEITVSELYNQLKAQLGEQVELQVYKSYIAIQYWHNFHMQIKDNKIYYIAAIDTHFKNLKWLYRYWVEDYCIINDVEK